MWIEPLLIEAKGWHGMRRFCLGRLKRLNTGVLLAAAGQNFKRLLAFGGRGLRE